MNFEQLRVFFIELKGEGFEEEIPRQVLAMKIADKLNYGDKSSVERAISSMKYLGFITDAGTGICKITCKKLITNG